MKYIKLLPILLLLSFSVKTIISGVDLPSLGVILGLCTLVGFFEYKENEKAVKYAITKVDELSLQVDSLRKETTELKYFISSSSNASKIGSAFSGQSGGPVKKF